MDILEAKKIVVEAGKQLVSTGLIARTWGNVSCRIDDKQFVITPSGKAYEGLTPNSFPRLFWVYPAIFRATGKVTFSIAISSSPFILCL